MGGGANLKYFFFAAEMSTKFGSVWLQFGGGTGQGGTSAERILHEIIFIELQISYEKCSEIFPDFFGLFI